MERAPQSSGQFSTSPDPTASLGRKRRRKVLSCLACRARKLKCDRNYPSCTRCEKAGQADTCVYDSKGEGSRFDTETTSENFVLPGDANQANQAVASDVAPRNETINEAFASVAPTVSSKESLATSRNHIVGDSQRSSREQEQRINRLERRIAYLENQQNTTGSVEQEAGVDEVEVTDTQDTGGKYQVLINERITKELVNFRGKEFKTQYFGPSNPFSIVDCFPDLRDFMKSAVNSHPSVARIEQDLKAFIARQKRAKRAERNEFTNDLELFALLPEKATTDRYVNTYFETFETTYRVLHRPSFMREYENLWSDFQKFGSGPAVIVLLIVAIVRCTIETNSVRFVGYSSTVREAAGRLIEVCESWLNQQSQKHATLTTIQVHCLLFAAKRINFWKRKRLWTVAGSLVRFGMSTGLHRDPGLLNKKISVFAQEMRRRLWATMIELELQASIDRGMPAISAGLFFDCGPPANIDDQSLQEDSSELVCPKPINEFTSTSFLHLSQQSLSLRTSLNSLINGAGGDMDYSDVMIYDERIKRHLSSIPDWANSHCSSNPRQDNLSTGLRGNNGTVQGTYPTPDSLVIEPAPPTEHSTCGTLSSDPLIAKALLRLQLQQFLILMHAPFARRVCQNAKFQSSVLACYEAAHRIVELHSELLESGSSMLGILRNDVAQAAFSICHNVCMSCSVNVNICLQHLGFSFLPTVEKAMSLIEDKVMRMGTAFQAYCLVSAAYAMTRLKKIGRTDASHAGPADEAVERLTRICYKVLALQEEPQGMTFSSGVAKETLVEEQQSFLGQPDNYQSIDDANFFGLNLDDLWNLDFNIT